MSTTWPLPFNMMFSGFKSLQCAKHLQHEINGAEIGGKLIQNWREIKLQMEGNETYTHFVLIGNCSAIISHPVNTS